MKDSIRVVCTCLPDNDASIDTCAYHNEKKAQALTAKHDHERRLKEAEESKSVLHDLRNSYEHKGEYITVVGGQESLKKGLRDFLIGFGEDNAETIENTPLRFVKALEEMTSGYTLSPEDILSKVFVVSEEKEYDDIVILKDISFTSICEHHLLNFTGTVDIGYIPGKVVGLSKLARLVDCFSKRLQMQERMTTQIADSIEKYLDAKGVAVVSKGVHSCLSCRGIKKADATMVCSAMNGVMRTDTACRAEFLQLCKD